MTSITSQSDIDDLLNLFGGFHDGCLREAHMRTETYVMSDLRMQCPGHLDTSVRFLFQRQFKNPSAIELLFEEVVTFHLQPSPDNYDSIIYEATLLHSGDLFFGADSAGWSRTSADRDAVTWISSKKLSWREVSAWMGPTQRYFTDDITNSTDDA